MHRFEPGRGNGHRDLNRTVNTIVRALRNGRIGPNEEAIIRGQFANLGPQEEKQVIHLVKQVDPRFAQQLRTLGFFT